MEIKWKNRDINVVEQANIPLGSLRLFELFFDDAIVSMIVGYIKLYGRKEKADT